MEAGVDQFSEAGRDIAISMVERIGEDGDDRAGGVIDDVRVALKRVTMSVIVIGQESPGSMQCSEDLIGVLIGPLLALRAGTEPEPRSLGLQPRCATPPSAGVFQIQP